MIIGDRFYYRFRGGAWTRDPGFDRSVVDRPCNDLPRGEVAAFHAASWPLDDDDDGLRGHPDDVAAMRDGVAPPRTRRR